MFTLLLLLVAGFVIDVFVDGVVDPATILLVLVAAAFGITAALAVNIGAVDVDEHADADVVEVADAVPTTEAANVILCESSLCHLALLCRAALICVHNSFLHDFDL